MYKFLLAVVAPIALVLVFGASSCDVAAAAAGPPSGWRPGQAVDPADPQLQKPRYPKLGSRLSELASAPADRSLQARMARGNGLLRDGQLPVTIRVKDSTAEIERYVAAHGGRVANVGQRVVETYLPFAALTGLDGLPSVLRANEIVPPRPRVTSYGTVVHNSETWNRTGYSGQGVKVGIIDTFENYASLVGTELPAPVAVRCYTDVGVYTSNLADCGAGGDHGTAVAEAVIDVAPAASLYLAYVISGLDLQNAVQWMRSQGVKVINESECWTWDGPGDGTSPDSDSPLATVDWAARSGVTYVASAGNEAEATWFGPFVDTNGNRLAEFGGADNNWVQLIGGTTVIIQLRWADSWSAAVIDLDLRLYDQSGSWIDSSVDYQNGTPGQRPFELIATTVPSTGRYSVRVDRYSGQAPAWLQLQMFTGEALRVNSGGSYSIGSPAESATLGVVAVGATSWDSGTIIEPFSSQGPTPDGRVKPDIVGVDRGDSVTYGPSGFAGTSQASPHVAGLAALISQAYPAYTPSQVAGLLKAWALPRGASVPNNVWGSGLAYLPTAGVPFKDSDSDGLPDTWEVQFGLNPNSAAGDDGPNGDRDQDGQTNLAEYQAGTHPRGFHTRYFAEGAIIRGFFNVDIALVNPDPLVTAHVLLRFQREGDTTVSHTVTVPARGRRPVRVNDLAVMGTPSYTAFSTVIESDVPVVADRTMTWDSRGYGSHAETSIASPAQTWYLAEGATHSGFELYYLIQNPNATAVTVQVTYLRPSPLAPVVRQYVVGASSRKTIYVNGEGPELAATDVSATIESLDPALPIVVERAMYLTDPWGHMFGAGHESAGVTAPSAHWFLAEGATVSAFGSTGSFFDMYVLIANPGATASTVTMTYLLPDGTTVVKTLEVAGNSRQTVYVNGADARLADTSVSTVVTATQPVIVERAMWWPGPTWATWYEAHNSPGTTETGTLWALAEGESGTDPNVETYILIANTSAYAGQAKVTLLFEDGTLAVRNLTLLANSRRTVYPPLDFPSAQLTQNHRRYGALIESTGTTPAEIVVERAMYSNDTAGVVWAAGTNAVGARLAGRVLAPAIASFTATPSTISPGGTVLLAWTTANATTCTIDAGEGIVATNGSLTVSPSVTTVYTLTATGPGGAAVSPVTVTVARQTP